MSYNGRDIKKATKEASRETKKSNPYSKDAIVTWLGQFMYPGQITHIPSNQITMQGIPYPVRGVDNTGFEQMMYPGMNYIFPGTSVTEYPQTQKHFYDDWAKKERWATNPNNPINKITRQEMQEDWARQERWTTNPENFPKGNYELYRLLSNYATGGPSVEKAKAMLEDGTAWGHPLTQKQIDLFRSIVGEEEDEDTGEEYRRGGQKRKMPRNKTSRNIQSSLNFLMLRNPILYGRYNQAVYDPNAQMEFGGWLEKYQDGATVLNRLKEEQAIRDAAEMAAKVKGNIPGTTFVAPTMPKLNEKQVQFASLPKAQQEAIKQQNLAKMNRKPEAQLKQGKPMTKEEKTYSEKVKARIENPFSDVGIAAGNIASYLTRFQGLSPEEIARVTNNPMETLKLSSDIGTQALVNEITGMAGAKAIGKGVEAAAPYVQHLAEDLPHYLPKVSLKGKPSVKFPEYADYYRIQPHGFSKSKVPYNPNLTPEQNLYTGRWVETDPIGALDYVTGIQKKNPDLNPLFDVIKGRMPKSRLEQLRGENLPAQAKLMSYGPGKHGTWESAFSEGAITDLEKSILSLYEKNPEMFKQGSLHKAYYDNVVRKIAANPELIKTSEALLPAEKINLANLFNKKVGLTSKEAEEFLRKAAENKGGLPTNKFKKYSPFKEGGTTKWLDNYE